MLLTPERVVYIMVGDYLRAGVDPPILPARQYEIEAETIHDEAGRPTDWPDPRGVALEWGIRVIPSRRLPRGAATTGDVILYRPSLDPRARGLVIWHELCHCYLRRFFPDATEADAWILTGAVVARLRVVRSMGRAELVARQKHAPDWFLDLRLDYVRWLGDAFFWAAE